MKKFDITTYCPQNFKAGVILEKILNEKGDIKLIGKVGLHITRFQRRLKSLDGVDITNREYFVKFLFKDTNRSILDYKYEISIETHLLNIIAGLHRRKLREINAEKWQKKVLK